MTDSTAPIGAVNEYGVYVIPAEFAEREVCRVLRAGKVNEPRTISLIRAMARDGDVISGGSFVGDFLPPLSQGLAPGARLHAFEPNPPSFRAAQAVLRLNALDNVELHPVAVGAAEGTLPLKTHRPDGAAMGGLSRIVKQPQENQTIDVPVRRLDDLVPADRSVSVLHLDVEGFEGPALRGAARIIETHAPFLVLEANTDKRIADLHELLQTAFPAQRYRPTGKMERNVFFIADTAEDPAL